MTELQTKQLALLEETVAAYTLETRATQGYGCAYLTDTGRKCAIGRLVPDEVCRKLDAIDAYTGRWFMQLAGYDTE